MSSSAVAPRSALAEPTSKPGAAWITAMCVANLGIMAGFFGPIQVLLGQQAELINPAHKESTLAIVQAAGALSSTVFNPIWGLLSDRTMSRFGRRVPWVAAGAVSSVVAMVLLSGASSVWGMVAGWALAQAAINMMFAPVVAAVPDQVPVPQRATVGGLVAVAQTVGVVAGSGIAAATGSIVAGYFAIAGAVFLCTLPYLLRSRDVPLTAADLAAVKQARAARSLVPMERQVRRDYWWAFVTRFLMQFGNAFVLLIMLYFLQDSLHLGRKGAESGVFALTTVYGAMTLITGLAGGILSDRLGRRKIFVIVSGLVVAGALFFLAFTTSLTMAFAGAIVMGLGFGMYQAVDFALITQVLPHADDRGRDMGILNIAAALPQVAAPLFALVMFQTSGVNYPVLFIAAGLVSVLGSVLVVKIKSVV